MAEAGGGGFNSKSIAIRAQKKLLGKMATKNVAKAFIDDTTGELLDQIYKLAKADTGSKKEAEKLVKNLIKIVVKMGILFRNNQFNSEEMQLAEKFRGKFRSLAMTFISFYEVDFSFDRNFLTKNIEECKTLLHRFIGKHLTEKSHGRVDLTFNYFGNGDLLEKLFQPDGPYSQHLKSIAGCLNKLVEEGNL